MVDATEAAIARAAALLRAGRLVAFPTETVYGLGANALDPEAVARIYAVKRRPATSPLIVHVASVDMAKSLVADWPETAALLTKNFWPGPLTLVLPVAAAPPNVTAHVGTAAFGCPAEPIKADRSHRTIPPIVTAGLQTVGLRMPNHPAALALIEAAALPLAAPSANRFTELSPTTADHVRQSLGSEVDLILDGGPCTVGIESTVLSLAGPSPVLLRPGGISRQQLEAIIGPIATLKDAPAGAHPAPGMHARHYSPRTVLYLVQKGEMPEPGPGQRQEQSQQSQGLYLQLHHPPTRANIAVLQMPQSAAAYAAKLYDVLHQADNDSHSWIAVDLPPDTPEWEAVQDRLKRAASKE
jgi:L-threonylcarbamoyladenylate synthase